ncbi:hypothetical protein ACFOLF_21285 [Paenibacillus sepulcri]|uniref:Uncharacterized protein n=1 Tax=Paenibacillus sepulcri TaxID=359917 RepID=A0ABS7BWQ4_9BACL|nr:hypothetical protein [Paenibacillus sepulcri]
MISIVVDESSLEINNRKSITGEIYLQFGDSFFPESNWNDFIVVVLTWWNKSIRILENSSVGVSQDFNFMDGPFYVRGVKKDSKQISLSFNRRNKAGLEVIASLDTEIDSLKKTIAEASIKVLKEMHAKNWATDDIEELKKHIQ